MIIKSEKMAYDGKKYVQPVWQLDTGSCTVIHYNENRRKEERTPFYTDHIRYHINYSLEYVPDRLRRLVNSGEILDYLERLDERVSLAVDKQVKQWEDTDKEYILAVENGDIVKQAAITNMMTMRAKEIVFNAVMYV